MPIYEYKCDKCGCLFEVRQDFDDEPLTECRNNDCKGPVHRVFSPPTIIFKGSGFYTTDYGHANSKPASEKSSDSSTSSEKPSSEADTNE